MVVFVRFVAKTSLCALWLIVFVFFVADRFMAVVTSSACVLTPPADARRAERLVASARRASRRGRADCRSHRIESDAGGHSVSRRPARFPRRCRGVALRAASVRPVRRRATAVAEDQRRRDARVDPAHVVLTASTSEAYSWLFKLLCNPGEAVLVPRPSYPLFEHLTALEGVRAHQYALEYDGRWVDRRGFHRRGAAGCPRRARGVAEQSDRLVSRQRGTPAHRESLPGPALGADRRRGVCGLSPRRHEPADRHCRGAATCCRSRLQASRRPWGCRK